MFGMIGNRKRLVGVVAVLVAIVALVPVVLAAPSAQQTPGGDTWWPSMWGSGDEAGAS